jgi:predicted nucleotidyltransferase
VDTEEIISHIRKLNPTIEKKYKAKVKSIFGSYVRGDENPESDLDVLVEFKDNANLLDLVGLSNFLEEKLDIPIDVVPEDTIRKEIKKQVLKEAIPL